MRGSLIAAGLMLAHVPACASAGLPAVVQDPYLELRTGPGRGFPVTQILDHGAEVDLIRRRTDWIKVRAADGRQGWVHRTQLEQTLSPGGEPIVLPGRTPETRTAHRWETGLATGDFGGASVVRITGAYALTPSLLVRIDAAQLLGNASNGWLGTAGILHVVMPEWRVAPFVGIGGGAVRIEPKATLVEPPDRTDTTAYAALGMRGYLSNRFLLQAEYREYVVFTSRDDNEEIDEWTVGFTYFF